MSSDYYEPHARRKLARPLVIAGDLGCGARLIGRTVCARTGLPFVEVDRQIEHEAGESLDALAARIGRKRIAERARMVLERVAIQQPWSVAVLEWVWPGAEVEHLFRRKLQLVHIRRPANFLLERIEKEVHRAGPWLLGDCPFVFRTEADLAPLQEERARLLCRAAILLEAGDRHAHLVSKLIVDSLDSIFDTEGF